MLVESRTSKFFVGKREPVGKGRLLPIPEPRGAKRRAKRVRQGCCGVGHRPEQPDRPSAGLDGARRAAPRRSQSTLVVWFLREKRGKKEGPIKRKKKKRKKERKKKIIMANHKKFKFFSLIIIIIIIIFIYFTILQHL